MKLKFLFFFLALLLTAVWTILLVLTLKERGALFYIGEGVITFSLVFLVYFYRKVVKPLDIIGNGMELLREQDFSSRLTPVGQKEADRIVLVFNRMMEQLKDERLRLREQNHFLDLLVSASPMGVVILTLDGHISMLNAAALRFLDYSSSEEVRGRLLCELASPLAEEIERIPKDTTETIRLSDSMIYRCSRLSFVDRGFSHPKKAYEKVIRMIAHEVNNTTAGITSTLDTVDGALECMEDTEDLREVMKVCIERCYSMSRFITNFANVVKIPEPRFTPTNLNDLAFTCKRFMEGMCNDRNIELRLECDPEVGMVRMDASLFEQVLVNIIKNAAESIEGDAGENGQQGEIIVRTTAPALIEIVDNGPGISKETEAKLFSPFFSTKPNGQGIGLVFIREVLSRHGCTFSLRTYNDGLTRFRILFNS